MPFNSQRPNAPRPPAAPTQEPALDSDDVLADQYLQTHEDEDALAARYADVGDDRYEDDGRFDEPASFDEPVAFEEPSAPSQPPPSSVPRARFGSAPPAAAPSGEKSGLDAFLARIVPLNDIELGHVLRTLGATVDPNQRSHWVLPDGHVFQRFPRQQIARDLADNKGGLSPVNVVARAKNIKPGQAAAWMEAEFTLNGVVRDEVPRAQPKDAAPAARPARPAPAPAPAAPAEPRVPFAERIAPLETIALHAVMTALDAQVEEGEDNARTWTLPNGKVFQGWANSQIYRVPNGRGGKGPMALIAQALDLRPGQSAQWLEERFLDAGQLKAGTPTTTMASATPRGPRAPLTDEEKQARNDAFKARCDALDLIDLDSVIEVLGGRVSGDDATKFKMPNGNNIWHKRHTQVWKDLTNDKGGSGGVWLVQYYKGIRPGEAAAFLEAHFTEDGQLKEGVEIVDAGPREEVEREYNPQPRRNEPEYVEDVRRYLVASRMLPRTLIDAELQRGNLYPTYRSDRKLLQKLIREQEPQLTDREVSEKAEATPPREVPQVAHCVFSSPFGAEIRSVDPDGFKGTAPGTNPNRAGYCISPIAPVKEPVMALVEAAVSGLSYRTFFPGRFTFSTNGVSRFNLQLNLIMEAMTVWDKYQRPDGSEVQFGARVAFDADIPGDRGAQRIFNAMYLMLMIATPMRAKRLAPVLQGRSVTAYLKTLSGDEYDTEELAFNQELLAVKEELFDNGAVSNMPGSSPHELFWGLGLGPRPDLPVHVRPEGPIKDNESWTPTDQTSGPVIVLNVNKPVLGLTKGPLTIPVNPAAHDYIVHQLNIRRDRPPVENDWNDELKALGPAFSRAYDACAAKGFVQVPELPPHMAHFYQPAPRYQPPAPPAPATPGSQGPRFRR